MSDIELVIKIPEDVYTRLFDNGIQDNEIAIDDVCEMARALRLGAPLPKGHGRKFEEMTLDEAIAYHKRIANIEEQACFMISKEDGDYEMHKRTALHHKMLVKWLTELKRYRDQRGISIDDFEDAIEYVSTIIEADKAESEG